MTVTQNKPDGTSWFLLCLAAGCGLGLFLTGHDLVDRLGWEILFWPLFGPLLLIGLLAPALGALVDDTDRGGQAAVLAGGLLLALMTVDCVTGLTLPFALMAPMFALCYGLTAFLHGARLTRFPYARRIRLGVIGCALQLLVPGAILLLGDFGAAEGALADSVLWTTVAVMAVAWVMALLSVIHEEGRPLVDPKGQITGQISTLGSALRHLHDLVLTAVFFVVFAFGATLLSAWLHARLTDSPAFLTPDGAHGLQLGLALVGAVLVRRTAVSLGLKRSLIIACISALLGILGLELAGNTLEVLAAAVLAGLPVGIGLASAVVTAAGVVPDHKSAQGFGWMLLAGVLGLVSARLTLWVFDGGVSIWVSVLVFALALCLLQQISPARAARLNLEPGESPPEGIVDLEWDWSVVEATGQGRHNWLSGSIRFLARMFAEIFFSDIRVKGRENLRFADGAIIVANHPNTFFDPMLLTALVPARLSYLAKSTLWSTSIMGSLLDSLGAIPLYRRQDVGGENQGNERSLEAAARRLHEKGLVLIFPEGVSEQGLSLKPVKTGAARLGFLLMEATEWQAEAPLIPIAIDYAEPTIFRSTVTVRIGEPIEPRAFREDYARDPRATVVAVTDRIAVSLKDMLPHLDDPARERLVHEIVDLYGGQLQQIMGTEDETSARKAISQAVNHYQRVDPDTLFLFSERMSTYHRERERMATPENHPPIPLREILSILVSLFSPASMGLVVNWVPYRITGKLVSAFQTASVWMATAKLGVGALVFGLWYLLLWMLLSFFTGPLVSTALVILAAYAAFIAMGAMERFAFRFRQLKTVWDLFWTQDTNDDLEEMRLSLIQDLEHFRESYAFYHAKETETW